MIDAGCLHSFHQLFIGYAASFRHDDPDIHRNIELKQIHSERVRNESAVIAQSIGMREGGLRLAELIGLFHDVGRFEQYTKYHTFVDLKSENHAALGARIIRSEGWFEELGPYYRSLIDKAIRYHNRKTLPEDEDEEVLLYSRLVRDADKIDIFKVVTDYYLAGDKEKNQAIELDLPDPPTYSDAVMADLRNRQIVDHRHLRTLNDFKLLQMGWIFDMHYAKTFEIVLQRDYLRKMRSVLPASEEIDRLHAELTGYVQKQCLNNSM